MPKPILGKSPINSDYNYALSDAFYRTILAQRSSFDLTQTKLLAVPIDITADGAIALYTKYVNRLAHRDLVFQYLDRWCSYSDYDVLSKPRYLTQTLVCFIDVESLRERYVDIVIKDWKVSIFDVVAMGTIKYSMDEKDTHVQFSNVTLLWGNSDVSDQIDDACRTFVQIINDSMSDDTKFNSIKVQYNYSVDDNTSPEDHPLYAIIPCGYDEYPELSHYYSKTNAFNSRVLFFRSITKINDLYTPCSAFGKDTIRNLGYDGEVWAFRKFLIKYALGQHSNLWLIEDATSADGGIRQIVGYATIVDSTSTVSILDVRLDMEYIFHKFVDDGECEPGENVGGIVAEVLNHFSTQISTMTTDTHREHYLVWNCDYFRSFDIEDIMSYIPVSWWWHNYERRLDID